MTTNPDKLIPLIGSILPFSLAFCCFFFPKKLLGILNYFSKEKDNKMIIKPVTLELPHMRILGIMMVCSGIFLILVGIFFI